MNQNVIEGHIWFQPCKDICPNTHYTYIFGAPCEDLNLTQLHFAKA